MYNSIPTFICLSHWLSIPLEQCLLGFGKPFAAPRSSETCALSLERKKQQLLSQPLHTSTGPAPSEAYLIDAATFLSASTGLHFHVQLHVPHSPPAGMNPSSL
jgi:hypothetical protein